MENAFNLKNSPDFSGLFYHNRLPSWIYDLKNFQILEVNQSALDFFGFSKEEFLLLTLNDLNLNKEISALLEAHVSIDKAKGNVYFGVFTHQKKDGESLMEVNGHKMKFNEHNCMLVTLQDVTHNEKQLGLLKEKCKQLQAISSIELAQSVKMLEDYQYAVDQSASFTITDIEGVIIEVNDKFCKLSQYSREELIGSTHSVINSKYHSKKFFASFWDTIKSGKIWRGEVRNLKKDGSYYWVDTTVVPFLDHNNSPFKFLALRIDITAKKITEGQIKEAYEKLKTISWTQSHIVRAPLARILGIINLIENQKYNLEEDLRSWLNQLKTSSDELDDIVKKIIEETQYINKVKTNE